MACAPAPFGQAIASAPRMWPNLLMSAAPPVREALSRLQERGLLQMTSTGLAVTQLDRMAVLELYAVRELMEGSAARFAAQHASVSDLFTMRQIA